MNKKTDNIRNEIIKLLIDSEYIDETSGGGTNSSYKIQRSQYEDVANKIVKLFSNNSDNEILYENNLEKIKAEVELFNNEPDKEKRHEISSRILKYWMGN